jgi:hypothetical protein
MSKFPYSKLPTFPKLHTYQTAENENYFNQKQCMEGCVFEVQYELFYVINLKSHTLDQCFSTFFGSRHPF